jgi:hypothetical protein
MTNLDFRFLQAVSVSEALYGSAVLPIHAVLTHFRLDGSSCSISFLLPRLLKVLEVTAVFCTCAAGESDAES